MHEIYQQRAQKGLKPPIVLEYATNVQKLVFFGVSHSNDPNDEQWPILEDKWQAFLQNPNPNKIVITESHLTADELADKSRVKALADHSESGLMVWLAVQASVEVVSGEPDREAEIEHLKKTYSNAEIMAYYFGRQMFQWLTRDHRTSPDWQEYARDSVAKYNSLGVWGEDFDLELVLAWFGETMGKPFGPKDKETLYALGDPSQSVVSSASGRFRDEHLLGLIQARWQQGKDIFAVYGSGHAIVLEPALEELTGKNRSEI